MDRPIPLRPDPYLWRAKERRSFTRACAALAVTTKGSTTPRAPAAEILKANWRDDDDAGRILKAATTPLSTSDFAAIQSTRFLEMLAPDCAAAKVLGLGNKLSLDGVNTIKLPYVGGAGRPVKPAFIAEGAPAPAPELSTSGAILGPTCKVLVQAAISGELQSASAETAERIVGMALSYSTTQSLDAALFSSNAAVPGVSPAGILHGITAIPSASGPGPGPPGCAADLAAIAEQIGLAGVSVDDLIFVMTPSLATKARIYAGPHFNDAIFSSSYLPDGTIVGLIPAGIASGYQGQVAIETSLATPVVMDDTAPPAIGTPGSPNVVGAPTVSAWQAYLVVVKVMARMAWAVQPACVATVSGGDW
jgi:hypothetical protein